MRCSHLRLVTIRLARRHYTSPSNLIQIKSGTFYREHPSSVSSTALNPPLFPNLTFSLPASAQADVGKAERTTGHWAVIGSGDTTAFLDILRGGFLCIPPNARSFPYLSSNEIGVRSLRLRIPSNAIQYVGFNTGNKAGAGGIGGTQGAYLSARYESRREETDWSVWQYLRGETDLNPSEQLSRTVTDTALLDRVIRDLRLGRLLNMPVSNLSNGQTRRCRIAKALLSEPACLLLDEPFMGLDPPSLVGLSPMLKKLAYESNPILVLGLRPQDPIPDWITDLVVLGKDHGIGLMGSKTEVVDILGRWAHKWERQEQEDRLPADLNDVYCGLHEKFHGPLIGFGDSLTEKGIVPFETQSPKSNQTVIVGHSAPIATTKSVGEPLIEMDSIILAYGDKVVLGHKTPANPAGGLTLTISQGSRLALLGPNGSGKTTLLSLLTSDHPQSYSLPIKFFGRTRLPERGKPGLSRWEIQSRIGHSAPEVHVFYPKDHTVRRVLESAWAETYSSRPKIDANASALVDRVLAFWAPELRQDGKITLTDDVRWADNKETHYFRILPFGAQRLLLLLRAIIRNPDIVILDEAFSGLDSSTRDTMMGYLYRGEYAHADRYDTLMKNMPGSPFLGLTDKQALVVVSHLRNEVPEFVDEWVRLPSEEEATEMGKDVMIGNSKDLANGKGLRSKEGWNEVWGL